MKPLLAKSPDRGTRLSSKSPSAPGDRPLVGLKHRLACLFLWSLGCLGTASVWAGAATDEAAGSSVDRFHELLIEAMRTDGFDRRAALLESAVTDFFDLGTVARVSVGPSWRQLAEERRSAFVALMHRLITATYADRFDGYSGQSFVLVDVVSASTGPVVKTLLNRASGEPVNLDYYFRRGKVFNVVADGVSDLSLRRADYAGIIRKEGFDGLVTHLEANIAELGGAGD